MTPNISIIILTYNGSRYIERLLASLADQTYPGESMEIIVVDNGSEDNTLSIVTGKYPHVRTLALGKNTGFSAGNNHGARVARHDYLVFLNQDTVCHRFWLQKLIEKMVEDPDIAACASNIVPVNSHEIPRLARNARTDDLFYCDLTSLGYGRHRRLTGISWKPTLLVSGCAFVIRKSIAEQMGYLFDEQLWMYAEDTELSLRLYHQGARVGVVKDAVVYHRQRQNPAIDKNALRLSASAIQNRVYAFYKNMNPVEFALFFPILCFGGSFKILEFQLAPYQKALFFIPFAGFSMASMLIAAAALPKIKRRSMTPQKRVGSIIRKILLQGV